MPKFLRAFLLLILSAPAAFCQSENYRPFKFDVNFGYASPLNKTTSGNTQNAGFSFSLHPHYRLTDDLAVGLRVEGAAMAYQDYDASTGTYNNGQAKLLGSYCLTGEYYLSDGLFRPFIGAGVGLFSEASVIITDGSGNISDASLGTNKIGAFPTIGFEIFHFRASADYNYLPNKAGYWGIKAGFFIGGGPKDGGTGAGRSPNSRRDGGFRF